MGMTPSSGQVATCPDTGSGYSGVPYFYMGEYKIRPYKNTAFGAPTIPHAGILDHNYIPWVEARLIAIPHALFFICSHPNILSPSFSLRLHQLFVVELLLRGIVLVLRASLFCCFRLKQ